MNLVLIPYFLVANVVVNETETWIHGPEYTFAGSTEYSMYDDLSRDPFDHHNTNCSLKCRPKSTESLICQIEDTVQIHYSEDDQTGILDVKDVRFEIKFNKTGVESLLFEEPQEIMQLNMIRGLVTLLSVGTDFNANANSLPSFVTKEHFILGECSTDFHVSSYETSQHDVLHDFKDRKWNYTLNILTLPTQFGPNIIIVKRTGYKRCASDGLIRVVGPDFKINKSVSKIHVSKNFWSENEIDVKMSKSEGPRNSIFRIKMKLELKSIKPAKDQLPDISFPEKTSLLYGDMMQENFIP